MTRLPSPLLLVPLLAGCNRVGEITDFSVCDGVRLDTPAGGFVCTGVDVPKGAAYATVQTSADRTGWPLPLLQDDGQWVVLAAPLLNSSGGYTGAVTYRLFDAEGEELASVDGTLEASTRDVSDPATALQSWADAQLTAWVSTGEQQDREIGIRLQLVTSVYAEAASRTVETTLVNGEPKGLDWQDATALSQASEQTLSELSAAGLGGSWAAVDEGLVRETFGLLPGLAGETLTEEAQFGTVIGAIYLGIGVGVLVDVAMVTSMAKWIQDRAWEAASLLMDQILETETEETTSALCDPSDSTEQAAGPPPPSEINQCIAWNPDEPLAQELAELIPSLDEMEPGELFTPAPEGFIDGECSDGIDNDGNGFTDGDDEGCTAECTVGDVEVDAFLDAQRAALSSVYGMQVVPSGTYTIGCTEGQDDDCYDDEYPVHDVCLTQSYLIGETEVTQGLYTSVMGSNPSHFTECGSDCPVEMVNWYEAVAFANALSSQQGLPECYNISGDNVTMPNGLHCDGFRLPTEAEWEVAARGGEDFKYSGSDNADAVAWHGEEYTTGSTHPVGQKQANGYGLYDMSGNVQEWVWDTYDDYPSYTRVDPSVSDGTDRVSRGGGWVAKTSDSNRISNRGYGDPFRYSFYLGFRLVLAAPSPN